MLFAKPRLLLATSLIILGLGSAHAVATMQAESVAKGLVEALVAKLNQSGWQVQVGEINASPYDRSVDIENIRILDQQGRAHSIDAITLKNIELNAERDFIQSMHVETRDAVVTLIKLTEQSNKFNELHSYLQALGINSGRIGHRQLLALDYDKKSAQLFVSMEGQLHHPADNRAMPLVDFHWQSRFSKVPDLKQQLLMLGNPENRAALAIPWTNLSLISGELSIQDQGAWEPLMRSAAEQNNMPEAAFRQKLKQDWQNAVNEWRLLPDPLKLQATQAVGSAVDSSQPAMLLNVDATNQQGNSIAMAMMTTMISPMVLTQLFDITLEAE
ncbi:hypothetical protein [Methylophaga sp. OBS3]|uniref:hypothetical protein n=1 Tax=Methylophaga sp. OBS3 TaxID=2991934 RepID=UPI0022560352|nr:hypothetical protein [Methylophaga sp. OBS3]MCX4188864.1 hypothetical protein [Methylophaga sp. OBS3]